MLCVCVCVCVCHRGPAKLIPVMAAKGGNVNLADRNGWTPLQLAARAGKLERTQLLLEAGANVTTANQQVRMTHTFRPN